MKKRIGLQGFLVFSSLALSIVFFGFLAQIWASESVDEWVDILGIMISMFGFFIRISARGHKAEHSRNSHALVTDGLYAYVRNPMYLGTFLIGCGAVLSLLKPWAILIFSAGYFGVYIPQVRKEEDFLLKEFGRSYLEYCRNVPRILPKPRNLWLFFKESFPLHWSWFSKESSALCVFLVLLAALLTFKDTLSYGKHELLQEPMELLAAVGGMFAIAWLRIALSRSRRKK